MTRSRRWRTLILRLGAVVVVLVGIGAVIGGTAYKRHVLDEPGAHISRESVLRVIAQESPILFRDGSRRIGVFFAQEHREYVSYDRIPRAWVQAIVSSEDQYYWSHPGVDVLGISRAMWRNIQAGKMVAGGSSLTQQTAKNLFYRPDRSLKSKWREFVDALRLEAKYSKEEILEFYANQFHVSSNGRGLGIAARYFFDKEAEALSTLECAFIAGMVKAPARYNPFVGDEERRARALAQAERRTHYVLDRMLDEGYLTPTAHERIAAEPIPFRRGRFQYRSSVIVDAVESRLGQTPFPGIFKRLGIDNPSTAGISIVTTLDADAQQAATYGLWHHLSEVGPLMEGLKPADLVTAREATAASEVRKLQPREFYGGTVQVLDDSALTVDIGGRGCTVDGAGLERMATILARARTGSRWTRATAADTAGLRDVLTPGRAVWLSVREVGDPNLCDLEVRPELQGAVMLLEQGRIRAMVGGNDNRNFNRAVDAKRQLGSTWKPLLYLAALQLGWSPLDPLDNRPNVFHFEGTWYYPRADHKSGPWASMAWAGTRSENLASIWLLAHLTGRLSPLQFREIAALVDLVPRDLESRMDFIRRIRDDQGVISTSARLPELAFLAARAEVLSTLEPDSPTARQVRSMTYGRGLESEQRRVAQAGGKRQAIKEEALRRTYRHLAQVGTRCLQQLSTLTTYAAEVERAAVADDLYGWGVPIREASDPPPPLEPTDLADLSMLPGSAGATLGCGRLEPGWTSIDALWLQRVARAGGGSGWHSGGVHVEGGVPLSVLVDLHTSMKRMLLVWQSADPYDMELLQYHPDFRVLVGMRYMGRLAQSMGVRQHLPPVLSMPLGAVDLSLESAATMYQGMIDAQSWTFPGRLPSLSGSSGTSTLPSSDHPAQLIAEIRDRTGAVLYRADPTPQPIADATAGRLVGDILRNVVRWGTGRRAASVTVSGRQLPLAGKTGTTNGFRNAAFAGFVPRVGEAGWSWGNGYTLVTYVGYDDNRSMVRRGTSLQGANGALPVWISTVQGMGDAGLLGTPGADMDDGLAIEAGFMRIPVASGTGLRSDWTDAPESDSRRSVLVFTDDPAGAPTRLFAPVGAPARVLGGPVVPEPIEAALDGPAYAAEPPLAEPP